MPETDAQGATEVQIPKTQSTVYLKEISVPQGYKLNTSSFNVALVAGETTSVAVTNQEQKGKITVRKNGEVLKGVTGTEGNLNFVYENASYAGAKYTVYAAEDIYSRIRLQRSIMQGMWLLSLKQVRMAVPQQQSYILVLIKL